MENIKKRFWLISPIISLVSCLSSLLIANDKVKFTEIGNIDLAYAFFVWSTKHLITCIASSGIILELTEIRWGSQESRKKIESFVRVVFLFIILLYSSKTRNLNTLSAIFFISSFMIYPPQKIDIYFIPPAISFILGFIFGSPDWLKERLLIYISLPHIFMFFSGENKKEGEAKGAKTGIPLFYLLNSFFLFISLRVIGGVEGLILLFFYSLKLFFPILSYIFSLPIPFLSFSLGHFYILEFQRGIAMNQPYSFISKIYVPIVITFISAIFQVLWRLKEKKKKKEEKMKENLREEREKNQKERKEEEF